MHATDTETMDMNTRDELIKRFTDYIDYTETVAGIIDDDEGDTKTTDLFSLFSELASLKTEVRTESRHFKSALDQLKTSFETMDTGYHALKTELDRKKAATENMKNDLLRPIILDVLDIRDRIEAGLKALLNYRPGILDKLGKSSVSILNAHKEGQEITLRQMDELLSSWKVEAIKALKKPLDPYMMKVIELDHNSEIEDGVVTEEFRKGFLWNEETLRYAEVKVNKNIKNNKEKQQNV